MEEERVQENKRVARSGPVARTPLVQGVHME